MLRTVAGSSAVDFPLWFLPPAYFLFSSSSLSSSFQCADAYHKTSKSNMRCVQVNSEMQQQRAKNRMKNMTISKGKKIWFKVCACGINMRLLSQQEVTTFITLPLFLSWYFVKFVEKQKKNGIAKGKAKWKRIQTNSSPSVDWGTTENARARFATVNWDAFRLVEFILCIIYDLENRSYVRSSDVGPEPPFFSSHGFRHDAVHSQQS